MVVSDLDASTRQRLEQFTTTADKIRFLSSLGMSTGDVARALGIRYQHAYNVLHAASPRGSAELQGPSRTVLTAEVDATFHKAVQRFLDDHPDYDLGKVLDEALYLWCAREQERAIAAQYAEPQSEIEREEYAAWKRIRDAAAARLFRAER
jgi:hypothetical protein